MDRGQAGATNPDQSGHGSNGNEVILHILQSFMNEALPSDRSGQSLGGGVLTVCRGAVDVFYSFCRDRNDAIDNFHENVQR